MTSIKFFKNMYILYYLHIIFFYILILMAFNFQQDIDLEESDSESRAGAGAEEDFLPKMRPDENGMSFYLLQPGMKIYRGSGTFTMSSPFRKGSPYFFTTTIDGARKYGAVFEFTIPEGVEYRLVAMDDENTIEALKRQAAGNQRISLLLEHNYTIGRRNSSTETDKEVGSYLCAQGYNGYGAGKISINTETGEILHNEIVLCDPSALIRRQITTDPTELATINQEYSAHKAAEDLRKQRLEKKKHQKDVLDVQTKKNMPRQV